MYLLYTTPITFLNALTSLVFVSYREDMILLGHISHPDRLMDKADPQWSRFGHTLSDYTGVLILSPFWVTRRLMFGSTTNHPIRFDFEVRNPRVSRIVYRANRSPFLAETIRSTFPESIFIGHKPNRGLDHGAWVPSRMLFPSDTLSVVQLSWVMGLHLNPLFMHTIQSLIESRIIVLFSTHALHPLLHRSSTAAELTDSFVSEGLGQSLEDTSHQNIAHLFHRLCSDYTLSCPYFSPADDTDPYSGECLLCLS